MSPELLTAAGTVIAALGTTIALLVRTLSAARRAAAQVADVRAELLPNHGGSARDSLDRQESQQSTALHHLRGLRSDMAVLHRDVAGMRAELRRLAEVDDSDRDRADAEHSRLWRALEALTTRTPHHAD